MSDTSISIRFGISTLLLLDPLANLLACPEVVYYKTYPAGKQKNDNAQQLLSHIARKREDLEHSFDTKHNANDPNNK